MDQAKSSVTKCRINFVRMLKELRAANTSVVVMMKARVVAMPTSAVAKCTGSVNANVCSETQPMEETLKVIISEPVTDSVNTVLNRDQPMLIVKLATKEWEFDQE